MTTRIEQELVRLRTRYPDLEYREHGQWVRLPTYRLPAGWSLETADVVFQIPVGFPGTPPYGIYVPNGLRFNGQAPGTPASNQPPYAGGWLLLSWTPDEGQWRVTTDPSTGANLLNWVVGFGQRFRE